MVEEWLLHRNDYENFLMDSDTPYDELANSFRENGRFTSEIGNAMTLAIHTYVHTYMHFIEASLKGLFSYNVTKIGNTYIETYIKSC